MFLICSKGFKIYFQNRKWNYPNRKWNYFSHFQASDQKTFLQNVFHLIQGVQNYFSKQEMELSKQEVELFLLIKKLILQNVFHLFQGFQNKFLNRKWNYPNRKGNYFSYFQVFDQKTSFAKCLSFVPSGSKLIFKTENGIIQTGNGIIQTGNGIISPTSRPLIKKLLLQNVSHLFQGFHIFSTNVTYFHLFSPNFSYFLLFSPI